MMFILIFCFVAVLMLISDSFQDSLIYNRNPIIKPRAYKVEKIFIQKSGGHFQIFYTPCEKYITWHRLQFIKGELYWNEWNDLLLGTPEECVSVLKKRMFLIGDEKEIIFDFD